MSWVRSGHKLNRIFLSPAVMACHCGEDWCLVLGERWGSRLKAGRSGRLRVLVTHHHIRKRLRSGRGAEVTCDMLRCCVLCSRCSPAYTECLMFDCRSWVSTQALCLWSFVSLSFLLPRRVGWVSNRRWIQCIPQVQCTTRLLLLLYRL